MAVGTVVSSLTSNTYFPDGSIIAPPVLTAVKALDIFTELHPQLTPALTAELNVLRQTLLKALSQWTEWLELTDELTITGLTPGTKLYAKVACINSASTSENLAFAEARPRFVE